MTDTLKKRPRKRSLGRSFSSAILRGRHFLEKDLWRTNPRKGKSFFHSVLKVLIVTFQSYQSDGLNTRAASLAYRTVFSLVPLLAITIGIAKGFGLNEILRKTLEDIGPMHEAEWEKLYTFVENTLFYANSGLFLGVGFIVLLYMVYGLLSEIERNLNHLWCIPDGRPVKYRIAIYLGLLLILPILLVASSGLTFAMGTITSTFLGDYVILGGTAKLILKLVPFVLIIFAFTGLFMILPNTKVKFFPAFIGSTLGGIFFQFLQMLYMTGVLWISRYNAIYGSLAIFFLMLLWMKVAWIITLFCVKLSYAIQNLDTFGYKHEINNISRRYRDFLSVVILHAILLRFGRDRENSLHDASSLSKETGVPIKLVRNILADLVQMGFIVEVINPKNRASGQYIPSSDPSKFSVGEVLRRIDGYGTEDFDISDATVYKELWDSILASRTGLDAPRASEPLINLNLQR